MFILLVPQNELSRVGMSVGEVTMPCDEAEKVVKGDIKSLLYNENIYIYMFYLKDDVKY